MLTLIHQEEPTRCSALFDVKKDGCKSALSNRRQSECSHWPLSAASLQQKLPSEGLNGPSDLILATTRKKILSPHFSPAASSFCKCEVPLGGGRCAHLCGQPAGGDQTSTEGTPAHSSRGCRLDALVFSYRNVKGKRHENQEDLYVRK